MNLEYWEKIGDDYETEIFDVSRNDKARLVINKLQQFSAPNKKALDVGCGIGNFLPALSSSFREVLAVDISTKFITKAKAKHAKLTNVSYLVADLSAPRVRLPMVDFALAVNSLITPSLTCRTRILHTVCSHLRSGGHFVMVVPSLESAFLTDFRLIEWNVKNGVAPSSAGRAGFGMQSKTENPRLHEGIVKIEDVPTKHYLEEELVILLQNRGMKVEEIQKIQYPWDTEFETPPRWMKAPFPWDWLCVAQKVQ